MGWAQWALIISGGLVLAGISYPGFARAQQGWKIGSLSGSTAFSMWYGFGGLAYLAGMGKTFGWFGLLLSIPIAFAIGFGLTIAAKRHTQLIALPGPILANIWFVMQ